MGFFMSEICENMANETAASVRSRIEHRALSRNGGLPSDRADIVQGVREASRQLCEGGVMFSPSPEGFLLGTNSNRGRELGAPLQNLARNVRRVIGRGS